jgi:hypothetical protein
LTKRALFWATDGECGDRENKGKTKMEKISVARKIMIIDG